MAAIGQHRAHLLTFDRLPEPEIALPSPNPGSKKKVVIAALGAIGAVALRMANLNVWPNAIGCLGAGFCTLSIVTIAQSPKTLARIRQVVLPLIGQLAVFSFAQAWANDLNRSNQIVYDNVITALLGANLQMAFGWLHQKGSIRTESQSPRALHTEESETLHGPSCFNKNWTHAIKLLAASGFGIGSFLSKDELLQPISSYFFSFFLSQVAGERLSDKLDDKIEQTDVGAGTPFRKIKTAVLTTAYVGQLFGFIFMPWRQSSPYQQMIDLRLSGAVLGLCDGLLDRSLNRRVERLAVEDLEELKKLPPPEKKINGENNWKYLAYRAWKIAVPMIAIGGIFGFTFWQNTFVLQDSYSKIALGSMLTGFLSGTAFFRLVDDLWDPQKRNPVKDRLMAALWYSPRIMGIDPIFLYYALINAVKMDGEAIDGETNHSQLTALFFAWFFYGGRMGHELCIGSSDRIGNAQIKRNMMAIFNAAMTTCLYVSGKN